LEIDVSAFLLVCVGLLVLANGFFVGAEFALVRARRGRVDALSRQGAVTARLALKQIDRIDEYLAACQLGITMASLGIGFLGEPAIARLLEPRLGNYMSHAVAVGVAITISYLLVTVAHITVGEQVPKIYAITHAEQSARWVARPLEWFFVASKPLTWVLNSISNAMLRVIGTDSRADFHESGKGEDLRVLIAESAAAGPPTREAEMLTGVIDLPGQQARRVMTPFHAVVTVPADADVRTALDRVLASGHTRLVVTDTERPEQVAGVVHTNALVGLLLRSGEQATVGSVAKPPLVVPETKRLSDLLTDLQRERATLAVVSDEYGVPAGIVTVEDIVEEIVGEIHDETDRATPPVRRLADGEWFVRGDTSLEDLRDYGIVLPASSASFSSVGGFVFDRLGRLPARGDVVLANGYSLRVRSVRGNRIEALGIRGRRSDAIEADVPPDAG
jgi:CBS domain containing-hemolysin-like protein